jgi:hypothetical protein
LTRWESRSADAAGPVCAKCAPPALPGAMTKHSRGGYVRTSRSEASQHGSTACRSLPGG